MGIVTKFLVDIIPQFSCLPMAPITQKKKVEIKAEDGEIDLSMSDLQEIPVKDISKTKVHTLDLSNNRFSILPKNFATLVQLVKLDLSKNELKELPDNFGDLIKLKHLDLYKNKLYVLPLSFGKLKSLKWLDLKDNPLHPSLLTVAGPCLEDKHCQKCSRDVVTFYSQLQMQLEETNRVEEEKLQQQKDLEEAQKGEENKKNKKNKKKKAKTNKSHEKLLSQEETKKKVVNASLNGKKINSKSTNSCNTSILYNFFKTLFVTFVLLCTTMFVLTAAKVPYADLIENKYVELFNDTVNLLPPNVQGYGLKLGELVKYTHVLTGQGVVILVNYFNNFRRSESVNLIFSELGHVFKNVTEAATQFYKTILVNK